MSARQRVSDAITTRHSRHMAAGLAAALAVLAASVPGAEAQVQRSMINTGFEQPVTCRSTWTIVPSQLVPGWETSHSVRSGVHCGYPSGRSIEFHRSGLAGAVSRSGNQHAELNAYEASRVYQNICLGSGEQVHWHFAHRGLYGTDVMEFEIGATGNRIVRASTSNTGAGGTVACYNEGSVTGNSCADVHAGNGWYDYHGSFVWTGASGIQEIGFAAISSSTGAPDSGNLLDDIRISLTPYVELSSAALSGAESVASTNLPEIQVSGQIEAPLTVTVSITGGTATLGDDYTTPNGSNTFSVTIPVGNYASGSIPLGVSIVGDDDAEADETIEFEIGTSPAYILSSTRSCGGAPYTASTYTIENDDEISGRVILDNGAGAGVAHNGVPDGAEEGLAGVVVRLTDCGATEYARARTDAVGGFRLPLAAAPAGNTLCLVREAVAGHVGVSGDAGETGGTVATPGYDELPFSLAAGQNYADVVFGMIAEPGLAADTAAAVAPGGVVLIAHRYAATTSGTASFTLANETGEPDLSSFTAALYRDADCSGALETGEEPVASSIPVEAGMEICLIVRVQAVPGAPVGARWTHEVTAATALSGTTAVLPDAVNRDVVTVTAAGAIELVKRVRNATEAAGGPFVTASAGAPGDVLEYQITFTNPAAEPVSNVAVFDETPAYTSLAAPMTVEAAPTGMTCQADVPSGGGAAGYAGALKWSCTGTMAPGGKGEVRFTVRIAE